ncbi:MAG: hypothetical protein ABJN95_16550 [Maribacter sp.]|uniref:hypothetical protein n=1 Tax=Maribacter sp. TaxID=1897614 RepID=UPI003296E061
MKKILERFSAVLLIGLLLIKVSAFHVYEHHDSLDDSNDHCELCVLTIEGQQSESLTPPLTVVVHSPLQFPSLPKIHSLEEGYVQTIVKGNLFARPPPQQLA